LIVSTHQKLSGLCTNHYFIKNYDQTPLKEPYIR
jgi:hypothetical protein